MSAAQFCPGSSPADIVQSDLGFMRMVRTRAVRGARTSFPQSLPPRDCIPTVCIAVQLEGCCTCVQLERELRLTPGSWALWDLSLPLRVRHEGSFDQVALIVPRAQLGDDPERLLALRQPLSGHVGPGRLVFQSVRALADELSLLAANDVASLASVVMRLVRVALGPAYVHRCASATSLSEK
jgi:AraC-binding-like domain